MRKACVAVQSEQLGRGCRGRCHEEEGSAGCKYLRMESLGALRLFSLLKIHREGVKVENWRIHTRNCRQRCWETIPVAWRALGSCARPGEPSEQSAACCYHLSWAPRDHPCTLASWVQSTEPEYSPQSNQQCYTGQQHGESALTRESNL